MKQQIRVSKEYLVLRSRSESEWLEMIGAIADERLRFRVSAIIWWDLFCNAVESKALGAIARQLRPNHYYTNIEEDICSTLVRFGYNQQKAERRTGLNKIRRKNTTQPKEPVNE